MKRTFLRILPLAVAVLLATSCSKDENNDNAVVNNGQENVQTKTLPISITVNQKGLSKLSCANGTGVDLQPTFETTDKLAIYNGETFLTDLVIKEGSISEDGKTATFEGKIVADGIADGTELTAKIGTPLTDAITATSREDAVQQGCYQISAPFVYSKNGNFIALEEQNAYIEVVWTNKGNATVEFTVNDSKTVTLQLNDKGQGWIVVPAGTKFTCAALGLTNETTTAAANIYGINREFSAVPKGYVDLGVKVDGKSVYWAQTNLYDEKKWSELTTDEKNNMPKQADFEALWNNCYWQWGNDGTNDGYYVFKPYAADDKQETNASEHIYSTTSDSYIFLPAVFNDGSRGIYWSGESSDNYRAFCLGFNKNSVNVDPWNLNFVNYGVYSVRLVRRSN